MMLFISAFPKAVRLAYLRSSKMDKKVITRNRDLNFSSLANLSNRFFMYNTTGILLFSIYTAIRPRILHVKMWNQKTMACLATIIFIVAVFGTSGKS